MRPSRNQLLLTGLTLASASLCFLTPNVLAQSQHKIEKSTSGGLIARTSTLEFETFFYKTGVRVFVHTSAGQAVDASRLQGTATFYHPNSTQPWFTRPFQPTTTSLDLAIGLDSAPRTGGRVTLQIHGLPRPGPGEVTFTLPLEFVSVPAPPAFSAASGTSSSGFVYTRGYSAAEANPGPAASIVPLPASPTPWNIVPDVRPGTGRASVGPGHRDWSSGRNLPLAKPWLPSKD